MTEQLPPADRVLVTIHKRLALLRVEGRGSFKSSMALREFGISALSTGCNTIVLDMTDCIGLDSTFMGTLAGLATRLRQHDRERGVMILLNLNPRVRGLVATLGLDRLAQTYEQGATPEELQNILTLSDSLRTLDTPENNRDETTRMMIEAHENLTPLTSDNIPRFKDVLTYLREDLNRHNPPGK
ncbi:MAG: STAS domain-containing protein [Kiritimatiellae bacterium]|nr:STAS domain-containing protein [Kiritimatiellia bacterium]